MLLSVSSVSLLPSAASSQASASDPCPESSVGGFSAKNRVSSRPQCVLSQVREVDGRSSLAPS